MHGFVILLILYPHALTPMYNNTDAAIHKRKNEALCIGDWLDPNPDSLEYGLHFLSVHTYMS